MYVLCDVIAGNNPFIVSGAERYPLIEGANRDLRCVAPGKFRRVIEYTWRHTAGGRPDGDLLTFDNLTREFNGRDVSCRAKYKLSEYDMYIESDSQVLKVYCK